MLSFNNNRIKVGKIDASKMHLRLPEPLIADRFKGVVLLFIAFVAPNVCVDYVLSLCFVLHYIVYFLVLQSS